MTEGEALAGAEGEAIPAARVAVPCSERFLFLVPSLEDFARHRLQFPERARRDDCAVPGRRRERASSAM